MKTCLHDTRSLGAEQLWYALTMVTPETLIRLDALTDELKGVQSEVKSEIRKALDAVDAAVKDELLRQISLQ